jgi:hypothetical protein
MRTSLFTVNDIGDPEPVIATVACNRIIIGEDASVSGWPLSDYEVKGNYVGSYAGLCCFSNSRHG